MSTLEYENYHCHSMYSNCLTQPDSTMTIEQYARVYRERGQHVLCLSEHGNRSNVWQQYEIAKKYSDDSFRMVPLAAAECYFVPVRNPDLKDRRNFHLVVIARDQEGFYELNEMISEAYLSGFYMKPRIDFELLGRLNPKHFLCTTACVAGPVSDDEGLKCCETLHEIFRDNFFLEVQHHPQEIQKKHNAKIMQIYRKTGIPLIYGTDSHYITHEDAALRKEQLLSFGIDNKYEDEFDLFLPTAQEAYAMMLSQGVLSVPQIREAMEHTLILRDCEGVSFTTEKKIPNSRRDLTLEERNHLYQKEVCSGYIAKAGMPNKEEAAQLRQEMNAVTDTGTADYFITMKDIVDEGLRNGGVLTTTGRGSGVSFATNYALGFTSINRLHCPVRLFPDRFISKERLASGSLPDLDLNMANVQAFEDAGKKFLGKWGCLPMIAYGTCKTLSAFKLLARARNLDFQLSNEISKQISIYETDLKHARENNQDDPDYDPEMDVRIEDYVDTQYLQMIEDSKQYKGIVTTIAPHPCAHLLLDRDIRREIGIIRVKAKTGSKEPVYAAYIDGQTADAYGYLKADYLRVDVVKTIDASFAACGLPVMPVQELLDKVKDDQAVWDLYAKGFTMGLNQVEKEKTTERVMIYKPRNVVELAAFVAAVRPGFKSMLDTFIHRHRFSYGIPSLDKLLQTKEIPDSFLMYDEQILRILQAAGIPPADAYVCVKAIKKKKAEKVASFRQRFETGFTETLKRDEGATDEEAKEIVDKIWTIINDAASYMFCAAHAFSMACDSLYAAWLKVHHPYEFYTVMLKLYTAKSRTDKIAAISQEMQKYAGIKVQAGKFGEDNNDWYVDKANKTISQSLSSIKFISANVAGDMKAVSEYKDKLFVDVLRRLQMQTRINTRQIQVLIQLGYFSQYGGSAKLNKLFHEFFEGPNKLTKTYVEKTVTKRLEALRTMEQELPDEELPLEEKIAAEQAYIGRCISYNPEAANNSFYVQSVDDKYSIRLRLYSMKRGTEGVIRVSKGVFNKDPLKEGDCITAKFEKRQRCVFKDGKRFAVDGVYDFWLVDYDKEERKATA